MKKYILYAHDGSGNHGCEALVRSTVSLLQQDKEHILLVSLRPEEDIRYGLEQICTIVNANGPTRVPRLSTDSVKAYLHLKLKKDYSLMSKVEAFYAMHAERGDVALSIGGDTYCYGGTKVLAEKHNFLKSHGVKTVYWGCSIEPELLKDADIAEDISRYDLVTARETISYNALKVINPNTVLVCDSAFLLPMQEVKFPEGFDAKDIVGINSSPLVEQSGSCPELVRKNYRRLMEYILHETDMNIMLIPHVIWSTVDDRNVLQDLLESYRDSGRVWLAEDNNCEILKGYISKCRFFVGARTHATIAAYSTGVPTLVVGYSVKSKGIAYDLFGTDENYVLPVQKMKDHDDLVKAFRWILQNENATRKRLSDFIPEYQNRLQNGLKCMKEL